MSECFCVTVGHSVSAPVRIAEGTISSKTSGCAYAAVFTLAWAAYLVYSRAGTKVGLHPLDFALLRYGGAATLLAPAFFSRGNVSNLGGMGWGRGLALTLCAGPIFIAASTSGFLFAPLAHGALAQPCSATIGTLLLATVFLGERLTRTRIAGIFVLLAGIFVVVLGGRPLAHGSDAPTWPGDLLFISAGCLWAGYSVLLRRWRIDPLHGAAVISMLSALAVLPMYLAAGDFSRLLGLGTGVLIAQLIVHGVLAGALAVIAFGRAVVILGAAGAAPFQAIVPGLAIFLGIPIVGEIPTMLQALGLVIAGVGLLAAIGIVRFPLRAGPPPRPM
jgi:drug/metabolite transporter (DMT)-like permease